MAALGISEEKERMIAAEKARKAAGEGYFGSERELANRGMRYSLAPYGSLYTAPSVNPETGMITAAHAPAGAIYDFEVPRIDWGENVGATSTVEGTSSTAPFSTYGWDVYHTGLKPAPYLSDNPFQQVAIPEGAPGTMTAATSPSVIESPSVDPSEFLNRPKSSAATSGTLAGGGSGALSGANLPAHMQGKTEADLPAHLRPSPGSGSTGMVLPAHLQGSTTGA